MRIDQRLAAAGLGLLCGIIVTAVALTLTGQAMPAPIEILPPPATPLPSPTPTPPQIRVDISGAVGRPGVYTLPQNAVLDDLLQAAGGLTFNDADTQINRALPLAHGVHVIIVDEPAPAATATTAGAVDGSVQITPQAATEGVEEPGAAVNLNTASVAELDSLPGVGPSTAEAIIAYREDAGPFTTIDEVMNVPGIGPAKFEQMAPFLTLDR